MPAASRLLAFGGLTLASAKVCDPGGKVPCWTLHGGYPMPQVAMGTMGPSYSDCAMADTVCAQQHARFSTETWMNIGGRHIDTANDYHTQPAIAEAMKGSGIAREDLFITTKCPGTIGFQAIIQCAEDNLLMLGQFGSTGVQYIDLLLVHFPAVVRPECRFSGHQSADCKGFSSMLTPATKEQLQDTWRGMEKLKQLGVVRSIGVSDYNITNLQDTMETAVEPIAVHQVQWNPETHDDELLSFSKKNGIQLQAWSPLGGAGSHLLSDPVLKSIAATHSVSAPQVALRWSLQRDVAVVVGTANPAHMAGDMDVYGFELTEEEIDAISALKKPSKAKSPAAKAPAVYELIV